MPSQYLTIRRSQESTWAMSLTVIPYCSRRRIASCLTCQVVLRSPGSLFFIFLLRNEGRGALPPPGPLTPDRPRISRRVGEWGSPWCIGFLLRRMTDITTASSKDVSTRTPKIRIILARGMERNSRLKRTSMTGWLNRSRPSSSDVYRQLRNCMKATLRPACWFWLT
jgi:hypothetical protein